ncbi:DUF3426 domain-containing protein [Thioalkalivibrio sp. XN279]|nr:DUF3426 domain-containing protein [Thioalkalivibrio sp. XN279]
MFHISAAELRAADGTVVCGECDATFDALGSLSETPPAEPPARPREPEPPPAVTVAAEDESADAVQARDEEAFLEELESLIGAEEQPEHEGAAAEALATDAEAAAEAVTPVLDDTVEEDWEDHAGGESAGAWEDDTGHEDTGHEDAVDAGADAEEVVFDPDSPFRLDADAMHVGETFGEPFVGADTDDDASESPLSARPEAAPDGDAGDHDVDAPERRSSSAAAAQAQDADEDVEVPEFAAGPPRRRRGLAVGVVAVALLVIAGAWAHAQRGTLLRHPAGEAVMGPIYALLGVAATPRWSPEKFRALKWEAEADPTQPERLIVAVEFLNSADFAQPYPVLRVVLEDRFGRRVGSQDVAPAEYLEGYSRGRRLPAGGRVRTTIEVPDPGARAEGFRVDFCLESGTGEPACGAETFR